jgi:hypothetical protein
MANRVRDDVRELPTAPVDGATFLYIGAVDAWQ